MPITKAVITAAGRGTRFLPAVKQYPKELIAILDKPQLQYVVEEMIAADITEVCIVHRENDSTIEKYFTPDKALEDFLEANHKTQYLDSLKHIWSHAKITFIPQPSTLPYGNGSPVLAAKSFIGSDHFVCAFGDDLTLETTPGRFVKKMTDTFEKYSPAAVVAVKDVGPDEIHLYGSAKLQDDPKYPHRISGMFEKLSADQAPSFFGQGGRFVYNGQKLLATLETQKTGKDGELWLPDANNTLAQTDVVLIEAFDSESDWYTTGDPLRWLKANLALALKDPRYAEAIRQYLSSL